MNYLIAQEVISIKGIWIFKGSKYTLNSEGYFHSFNDLPAIIEPDGSQSWFLNGKFHREDGPAVIFPNGTQYWYLNGKQVKPIEVLSLLKAKGVDLTHFALDKNQEIREAIKELL